MGSLGTINSQAFCSWWSIFHRAAWADIDEDEAENWIIWLEIPLEIIGEILHTWERMMYGMIWRDTWVMWIWEYTGSVYWWLLGDRSLSWWSIVFKYVLWVTEWSYAMCYLLIVFQNHYLFGVIIARTAFWLTFVICIFALVYDAWCDKPNILHAYPLSIMCTATPLQYCLTFGN